MPTSIQTGPENDQMTMSVARAAALLGGRRCTPKATEWRQQIRTSERQIQELASMSGHKSHKSFMRYIKVSNEQFADKMAKIWQERELAGV